MPLLLGAVASVACGMRHQAVWEVGDCRRLSLGGGRDTVGGLSWVGEIGAGSPSVLGRLVGERGLRGVWFPLRCEQSLATFAAPRGLCNFLSG